jgi:hypothetical protein
MERQSIPLVSLNQPQSYVNPSAPGFHFIPLSAPSQPFLQSPTLSAAKFQVDRWANWVKFVSVFILIKTLLSILGTLFSIFFIHQNVESIYKPQLLLEMVSLVLGVAGYHASVRKTSGAVRFYIAMLFVQIVAAFESCFYFLPLMLNAMCMESKNNNGQEIECTQELYETAYLVAFIVLAISLTLVCLPVCWCPCKMYRNIKIVENEQERMPRFVQPVPFMPVVGRPVI